MSTYDRWFFLVLGTVFLAVFLKSRWVRLMVIEAIRYPTMNSYFEKINGRWEVVRRERPDRSNS